MSTDAAVELDGQYRALREGAGMVDRSERGKLVVRGPDAVEFLQGQLTNDIEALGPGQGCYAALLDRKGHMQADMRVLRLERRATLARHGADGARRGRAPLRCTAWAARSRSKTVTADWAILSVIGPAAPASCRAPRALRPRARPPRARGDGVDGAAPSPPTSAST